MNRSILRFHLLLAAVAVVVPLRASATGIPVVDVALIAAVETMEQDLGARLTSISTAITTMDNRIDQRLYTLTNAVDAQSAKTASAIGSSAENANTRAIDVATEQRNIDSEKATRLPLDPCANASRGLGNVDMDRTQPALRTGAMRPAGLGAAPGSSGGGSSTGSAQLDKAIAISERNIPAPSEETQKILAVAGACKAYAAGTGPGGRAKMCGDAGTPAGSANLPNADVRADTLYDGAQTQANTGKINYTFNDDQMTAARAYLRNLHTAVEPAGLSEAELRSDAGRQYLALRDQYLARTSQAQKAEEEWINMSAPNPETIPVLQAMLDGQGAAAQYLAVQLPKENPNWATKGISFHSMYSLEADRRYQNPAWIKEIAAASDPLTLAREQLMVSAHTNYLMTKLLMAVEKSALTSGAMYQAEINRDLYPQLIEARKTAAQSRKPS